MVLHQACSSTSRRGRHPLTGSSQALSTPRMPPPRRSSCQSFRRTFCTTCKPGIPPYTYHPEPMSSSSLLISTAQCRGDADVHIEALGSMLTSDM